MEKKTIKPEDNASNMQNANKKTPGVNKQYKQNQDNHSNQLNPNHKKSKN